MKKILNVLKATWGYGFLKEGTQRKSLIRKCQRVSLTFLEKSNQRIRKKQVFSDSYYPSLNCVSKIINENLYLLCMSDEVKRLFSPKPIIYFRSARAKIYPVERPVGSFKCGKKRCEGCENVNKTENFFSCT